MFNIPMFKIPFWTKAQEKKREKERNEVLRKLARQREIAKQYAVDWKAKELRMSKNRKTNGWADIKFPGD